ncbi:MAG: cytochrome c peroxidase [Thermoanaerobaculia bacterium]
MTRLSTAASLPALLVVVMAVSASQFQTVAGGESGTVTTNEAPEAVDRQALARIERVPLGLPTVPIPADNPPTAAKIRLGRSLFLDQRLSSGGDLSCATCHQPEEGFTANDTRTAVGNHGKILRRNSPSLFNVAFAAPFFHDGRQSELDLQPLEVLVDPEEMAFPSLDAAVARVKSLPEYETLFEETFEGPPSAQRIGRALGSYLRTLLSAESPFDRWYFGGETDAVAPAAKRGFFLFFGDAGCVECHRITQKAALFTDHAFHNTGVARAGSDLGRYEVTRDPLHRWQFKTPILRNVALTGPYMHNGSLPTLSELVDFYNGGGFPHEGTDPRLQPLGLSEQEKADLVEFLESLTGDNVAELIRDARSEQVGKVAD